MSSSDEEEEKMLPKERTLESTEEELATTFGRDVLKKVNVQELVEHTKRHDKTAPEEREPVRYFRNMLNRHFLQTRKPGESCTKWHDRFKDGEVDFESGLSMKKSLRKRLAFLVFLLKARETLKFKGFENHDYFTLVLSNASNSISSLIQYSRMAKDLYEEDPADDDDNFMDEHDSSGDEKPSLHDVDMLKDEGNDLEPSAKMAKDEESRRRPAIDKKRKHSVFDRLGFLELEVAALKNLVKSNGVDISPPPLPNSSDAVPSSQLTNSKLEKSLNDLVTQLNTLNEKVSTLESRIEKCEADDKKRVSQLKKMFKKIKRHEDALGIQNNEGEENA